MSVPEYVFLHRIQEFYDELRSGKNLWKIDEALDFVDERGRQMIKRWVQDERYTWTFGRGFTILQQAAPIVSLVVDSAADRIYSVGNYGSEGIVYDPDNVTPQMHYVENVRIKNGSFTIVMTAPNSDMLTAMCCLIERALYEGETAGLGEEGIIQFNDYGISELKYSLSDMRPDQSYIPLHVWARTLRISCSYIHRWTGREYSKNGYAFSIDLGNIKSTNDAMQINPPIVDGEPVLPPSQSQTYLPMPGVSLTGSTQDASSVFLTADGQPPGNDNILIIPQNSTMMFDATIGANMNGFASALWKVGGLVRRESSLSSTTLVGITQYEVVADVIFSAAYIDITTDLSVGALKIEATGISGQDIDWVANIQFKEIS